MLVLLKRTQIGLGLVEVMIVVVVIVFAMALGLPSYQIWLENTRIRNAAEAIQAGLQKARVEAIQRNASVQFVLVGENSAWTVGCVIPIGDLDGDGAPDCPDLIESRAASEGASVNITVTATPAASTTITFTSVGLLANPPIPFTQVDIDSSKLSAADSRDLRVTVGAGGNTRMCDPDVGLSVTDPRKC